MKRPEMLIGKCRVNGKKIRFYKLNGRYYWRQTGKRRSPFYATLNAAMQHAIFVTGGKAYVINKARRANTPHNIGDPQAPRDVGGCGDRKRNKMRKHRSRLHLKRQARQRHSRVMTAAKVPSNCRLLPYLAILPCGAGLLGFPLW